MFPVSPRRLAILIAAPGLALGVWLILRHDAPKASDATIAFLAALPAICAAALAFALDEKAIANCSTIFGVGAALSIVVGAVSLDPSTLLVVCALASTALMVGGLRSLWRDGPSLSRLRFRGDIILVSASIALLALYSFYYIETSRDLMFADFMYFRKVSIAVARMLDQWQFGQLLIVYAASAKEDYSWLPALMPGGALALSAPLARWPYELALIVFYATPAYLALSILARDLARGTSLWRGSPTAAMVALGAFAAFISYPTGLAITARGMPDIGGLVLYVATLRLAWRLARLLALSPGRVARVASMTRRVALALALCLYSMFLFRRWYAFAGVGIIVVLALETAAVAARRGSRFRWRDAVVAAAIGALALFALALPVLVDWLPDPSAHDYVQIYAAYRKETAVFVAQIFDWYGAGVLVLAIAVGLLLALYSNKARLLRLTCGSAVVAGLLFLRVQTPYIHHVFLIAPAVTGIIGAGLLLLYQRSRPGALAAAGALAVFTLTPAVGALTPVGFAPTAGQPHRPRADMAELERLKNWFDAHASPQHRVCALGSSYTFSDQLIQELWQINPVVSPFYRTPADRPDVVMAHVDTADGAPVAGLKDCAMMLVGDPVQTHLAPDFQQTIIVPASEMLAGSGIGAKYKRSGETFSLENGVTVVVFERTEPLDTSDIAALGLRWRAARATNAAGPRGTRD